ncbi:unnamed protein product [Brassica rapa subsp. trilocularis]
MGEEKAKLALVLAAKSRSLLYTSSPATPCVFASPIHTLASVPFCWEDQPGKPKNPLLPFSYPKCLELPPRLLLPGEFAQMPLPERKHGLFGFMKKKGRGEVVVRGSHVFPSEKERAGEINNMKIMKFSRSGSFHGDGFWVKQSFFICDVVFTSLFSYILGLIGGNAGKFMQRVEASNAMEEQEYEKQKSLSICSTALQDKQCSSFDLPIEDQVDVKELLLRVYVRLAISS